MAGQCCDCDPRTCAVALGRWTLGLLLLIVGLQKFPNVGGFANFVMTQFEPTWLPRWLVAPYAYALPFLEVGLGILLLIGVYRNAVLFATGVLFLSLMFGQILLKSNVVAYNVMYVFMAAGVLYLGAHDRWVVGPQTGSRQV